MRGWEGGGAGCRPMAGGSNQHISSIIALHFLFFNFVLIMFFILTKYSDMILVLITYQIRTCIIS